MSAVVDAIIAVGKRVLEAIQKRRKTVRVDTDGPITADDLNAEAKLHARENKP